MPVRTAYRICTLCELACGVALALEDDRVVDIGGNPQDWFSCGYLCPKGANLGRLDQDPDRLRESTWEEAFTAVAHDRPPGVVSLPHGWGHDATEARVAAALVAGVNANAPTEDAVLDQVSGTAVFNGVPVNLARAAASV